MTRYLNVLVEIWWLLLNSKYLYIIYEHDIKIFNYLEKKGFEFKLSSIFVWNMCLNCYTTVDITLSPPPLGPSWSPKKGGTQGDIAILNYFPFKPMSTLQPNSAKKGGEGGLSMISTTEKLKNEGLPDTFIEISDCIFF